MSTHTNKFIALALVGACSFGAWKLGSWVFTDEAQGTEHAVDQLWIDHVPKDDRDTITHLMILDHPQGRFGAVGHSSQWRHAVDVFKWDLSGDRLGLFFPQDRVRGEVKVETWECEGEAPAPFQLCMRLTSDNGRSFMLYSREDWKVQPRDLEDSLEDLRDEAPELSGVLPEIAESYAEDLAALELGQPEDWAETWPSAWVF